MKKIYSTPNTEIVGVNAEPMMAGSVNSLKGEANSSTVGMSRSGSSWEDEEE